MAQHLPSSAFRQTFVVSICRRDQHLELIGTKFKRMRANGTEETLRIAPAEVPDLLLDTFGISLTEEEKDRLVPIAQKIALTEDKPN